jgi:hypothetical protein
LDKVVKNEERRQTKNGRRGTSSLNDKERWIRMVSNGQTESVLRELRGEKKVTITEKNIDELRSQFFSGVPFERPMDLSTTQTVQLKEEYVMKSARMMKNRSPGTDGLSGNMLRKILETSPTTLVIFTEYIKRVKTMNFHSDRTFKANPILMIF